MDMHMGIVSVADIMESSEFSVFYEKIMYIC